MFRRLTKKRTIVALSVVAALVVAGGAIAYFTATGTGSGTGSVGSTVPSTINPVTISGQMYPGGPTVGVSFTINNLSPGNQKFGQVVVDPSFGGGTGITGLPTGCNASWFQFNPSATTSYTIAGHGTASDTTATMQLNDPGVNQDACQGAAPVLHLITGPVS